MISVTTESSAEDRVENNCGSSSQKKKKVKEKTDKGDALKRIPFPAIVNLKMLQIRGEHRS